MSQQIDEPKPAERQTDADKSPDVVRVLDLPAGLGWGAGGVVEPDLHLHARDSRVAESLRATAYTAPKSPD